MKNVFPGIGTNRVVVANGNVFSGEEGATRSDNGGAMLFPSACRFTRGGLDAKLRAIPTDSLLLPPLPPLPSHRVVVRIRNSIGRR